MLNLKRIGAVNLLAALALVTACEQQTGRNYAINFNPDVEKQEQGQLLDTQKEAGIKATPPCMRTTLTPPRSARWARRSWT